MDQKLTQTTNRKGIVVYHDFADMPHDDNGCVVVPGVMLCGIHTGSLKLLVSGQELDLHEDNGFVFTPSRVFFPEWLSVKHDMLAIVYPFDVLKQYYFSNAQNWEKILRLFSHPVINFTHEEGVIFHDMGEILEMQHHLANTAYYEEMIQHMTQALFYMLLSAYDAVTKMEIYSSAQTNQQLVFKQFLELLAVSGGRYHKVSDFAKKLCITSQYLSKICVDTSGHTPTDFILQKVKDVVLQQIMYTNKSMKQMAYELGFSSPSFFGRYVKEHFGLTPKEMRNKK